MLLHVTHDREGHVVSPRTCTILLPVLTWRWYDVRWRRRKGSHHKHVGMALLWFFNSVAVRGAELNISLCMPLRWRRVNGPCRIWLTLGDNWLQPKWPNIFSTVWGCKYCVTEIYVAIFSYLNGWIKKKSAKKDGDMPKDEETKFVQTLWLTLNKSETVNTQNRLKKISN